MKDGSTRKVERVGEALDLAKFLVDHEAALIATKGPVEGDEFPFHQEQIVVGRGPGVDIAIDETSLSRQHASFFFDSQGFRVRDLGSTNGTFVNGSQIQAVEIQHGDRIELGECAFQFVVEKRTRDPQTYVIEDDH